MVLQTGMKEEYKFATLSYIVSLKRSELMKRELVIETHRNPEREHALRNQLNSISLAVSIAQKHLENGDCVSAQSTLNLLASQLNRSMTRQISCDSVSSPANRDTNTFRLSVIIVEDNPTERKLLTDLLNIHGVRVRVAKNGTEAIELLQVLVPDVILIDMHMPHCDGPATIRKICDDFRFKSLPIFAVTGIPADEGKSMFPTSNPVRRWFQKPVQPESLVEAIVSLKGQPVTYVA